MEITKKLTISDIDKLYKQKKAIYSGQTVKKLCDLWYNTQGKEGIKHVRINNKKILIEENELMILLNK